MIDAIVKTIAQDHSAALLALLLGNVAQAYALIKSWNWHRKDRMEDQQRWITGMEKSTEVLGKLTEAITQLRILVGQCGSRPPTIQRPAGGPWDLG